MIGIIIAAHGTSRAANVYPERITEFEIRASFPDAAVKTAYISRGTPTLSDTLAAMAQEGVKNTEILPLQIMNGASYAKLCTAANKFAAAFDNLKILPPLLGDDAGTRSFANAVRTDISEAGGFVLLVGHNTVSDAYSRLNRALDNAYAVDLSTDVDTLAQLLDKRGVRQLTLAPMFFAYGVHAARDTSAVCTALTEHGFDVKFAARGLGEYKSVREIYIARLRSAIA